MLNIIAAIVVSATIDSTTIFLGDQTDLHLQAICQPNEQVTLPVLGENLIHGIEIVDRTIIDTTVLQDGRKQYNQYLTITSFRDSLFYIKPLPFVCNNDTVWSESMMLNVVQPFEMDSADMAITDIKPIYKAPIWWWGIFRWVLGGILIAGIAVGLYFLLRHIGRYTGKYTPTTTPEPLRPAEEIALEKLDAIKEQKIWQTGQVKEYHTQLTDVVREYISRRYNVSSTEQTSNETLQAMKPILSEQKEIYEHLRKMLSLADLVKFAKWTATPDENELSLRNAYQFVHETTPAPDTTQEDKEGKENIV